MLRFKNDVSNFVTVEVVFSGGYKNGILYGVVEPTALSTVRIIRGIVFFGHIKKEVESIRVLPSVRAGPLIKITLHMATIKVACSFPSSIKSSRGAPWVNIIYPCMLIGGPSKRQQF